MSSRLYPGAHIELNFTSPLKLLVAVILSAQTTDRRVNAVTPVLFARYRTAADGPAWRGSRGGGGCPFHNSAVEFTGLIHPATR